MEKEFLKGPNAGSGLGLHLAKRIAELHKGNIKIDESKYGGAKFEITLRNIDRFKKFKLD